MHLFSSREKNILTKRLRGHHGYTSDVPRPLKLAPSTLRVPRPRIGSSKERSIEPIPCFTTSDFLSLRSNLDWCRSFNPPLAYFPFRIPRCAPCWKGHLHICTISHLCSLSFTSCNFNKPTQTTSHKKKDQQKCFSSGWQ